MLRHLDFDLAGLQEPLAFQLEDLVSDLPDYAILGVGRDDGDREGEYAAILYRRDRLRAVDFGTFWFSDTPDVPGSATWGNVCVRICTWAVFEDLSSGRRFGHYNVHLDHESQPSRERSADLLLSRLAQRDLTSIVTGDFNADEDNPAIQRLLRSGLRDTFRVIHPEARDVGTYCGFTDRFAPEKIDYILVSPAIEVLDAAMVRKRIDGRWPSDHAALTATLRLSG
jgi:endonuclease/exonuclease/phosphatase family metal-dependent hydrolase